ncbi:hypothetical protein M2323_001988 [Rhodoblastus acidophilus]|uniref:hypothetical protein n=1 Tax=Rhodoblastus acidophilus TaxID=1074 RepID=UPI0022255D3F|nr:hypothetical protein [Rhodoblastus acidophilus]MCW2285694.1 hypothetical protein [Rhodoblastus acidophilus]MCW2333066.1 hypothetical protein [Rhodoblastus acidophilus]
MTDATVGAISFQFKADVGDLKSKLAEAKNNIKATADEMRSRMAEATRAFLEFGRASEQTTAKIRAHGQVVADVAWNYGPWSGQMVETSRIIGTTLVTSLARANLAVKVLGTAMLGATAAGAAMGAMVLMSRDSIEEIGKLEQTAKLAGVSLAQLQNLQRAAVVSGGTRDDMATALKGISKAANDASRDENEFSKILAANGVALKDNQGQLRPTMSLMADYANMIKNAKTEQDKLVLLSAIGSGEGMLSFFEQGSEKIRQLAEEARKAGSAIDDAMVARAGEFTRAWKSAADDFTSAWKSSVMDVLKAFDRLRDAIPASRFLTTASGVKDLITNPIPGLGNVPIPGVGGVMYGAGRKIWNYYSGGGAAAEQGSGGEQPTALPDINVDGGRGRKTTIPSDKGGGAAKSAKDAKEAVERYIDSLKKANETVKAEYATWGLSNVERAKAVSLAQATAAAERDGLKVTEEQKKQIEGLAESTQRLKDSMDQMRNFSEGLSDSIADAMDQIIVKGRDAQEVVRNFVQQMTSAALKGALTGKGMFGFLGGEPGSGGLLGGAMNPFSSWLKDLPGRAAGGPVTGGRAYMVGENGPELFMPNGGGMIFPNGAGGGGGAMNVVVNNHAGAHIETRQTRGSNGQAQLEIAVRGIIHNDLSNNGGIARALQNNYGLSRSTGRT